MINYVFGYYQFWQNSGQTSRIASLKPKLEVDVVQDEVSVYRVQAACSVGRKSLSNIAGFIKL